MVHPPRKTGRFSGQDFPLQPDGTLRCPAGQSLRAHERRREADGSLRVVYAASLRSCRPCPQREQCQWQGSTTKKPRQGSRLLHPLAVGPAPVRLSRLEPEAASAGVHPTAASATGGGANGIRPCCQPESFACSPLPGAAGAFSSRLARALCSQWTCSRRFPGHDQAVRRPSSLCSPLSA